MAYARGRFGQQGITLIGLLFWAIVVAFFAVLALKTFPSVNEYLTIQRTINKIATDGPGSVQEVRAAFDKQKEVEYSISTISGKDLIITKENDKVVIGFKYEKEIELFGPVFLLIKYEGQSKSR